jgi:WD40 repeat protein
VSGGTDGVVRFWDLAIGEQRVELAGHTGAISSLALTRIEGRLTALSAALDGTIRVWDLSDAGRPARLLSGHILAPGAVTAGELDAHPIAISGAGDETVRVWDLTAPPSPTGAAGHRLDVNALAATTIVDADILVSGSDDGSICAWGIDDGRLLFRLDNPPPPAPEVPGADVTDVKALATVVVDRQNLIASAGGESSIRLWDAGTGSLVGELPGHADNINALTRTTVGHHPVLVSAGDDATVRVWNLATGEGADLDGHTDWVTSLDAAIVERRPIAVSGSNDASIRVWDLAEKVQLGVPLVDDADTINAVALTALDARPVVIGGGDDTLVRVWDLETGRVMFRLDGHTGPIKALAVVRFASGPVLVSGGDDAVLRAWDLRSRRAQAELAMPDRVTAITALPAAGLAVAFGWEVSVLRYAGDMLSR